MKDKKAAGSAAESADGKKNAAGAGAPAAKRHKSGEAGGGRARKRARDAPDHGDLISKFPDDILRSIITLLPTKDGARTQAIAHRWRPLWRSAPLNLQADYSLCSNKFKRLPIVSKILVDHHGPARRFDFNSIRLHKDKKRFAEEAAQIESWFHSRALYGLQDLHICFDPLDYKHESIKFYPLPASVLRCASTLVVAKIRLCDFPKEVAPSLSFDLLKQLMLFRVSISEDVFHGVLSGCRVLESLALERIADVGCFRIISPTLRIVKLCACFSIQGELVIVDAPRLERLLLPCPRAGHDTIQVITAPKLEILGLLSPLISEIKIANLVLQRLTPATSKNMVSTLKVLALQFSVPDLYAVIDVLRCFPSLEKLYITYKKFLNIPMKENVRQYDPTNPVECLETHLKELVLTDYEGNEQDVCFAKFFVLNAKVLKTIKFGVSEKMNKEWVAGQYRLLEVGTRASEDAEMEFIRSGDKELYTHELQIPSPDLV